MSAPKTEQAAHTPGPWRIATGLFDCDAKGWPISSAKGYGIGRVWDENGKPQNEANARLIAAAPELLEAAQPDVLDGVADHLASSGWMGAPALVSILRVHAAAQRAAIAKATGA